MAAPLLRAWNELSLHPELCVGTARTALSKVQETLLKEMDGLKKEGQSDTSGFSLGGCWGVCL